MRSLLGLLLPVVLLSFSSVACGEDETEAPAVHQQQQSELIAAGGACDHHADCKSGLTCEIAATNGLGVRGEPMMDPCDLDPNAEGCAKPKGKPSPSGAPTPTPQAANDPQPSGAPVADPIATRVCTAH